MHFQYTLLLSTLAFWGVAATNEGNLSVGKVERRLEKAARRANVEGLTSNPQRAGEGEPMEPSPTRHGKRSFQLDNLMNGLLMGSSSSATPASTPTPSSGAAPSASASPSTKRPPLRPVPAASSSPTPTPTPTPRFRMVKRQLGNVVDPAKLSNALQESQALGKGPLS